VVFGAATESIAAWIVAKQPWLPFGFTHKLEDARALFGKKPMSIESSPATTMAAALKRD
jgi:hypothetical protein